MNPSTSQPGANVHSNYPWLHHIKSSAYHSLQQNNLMARSQVKDRIELSQIEEADQSAQLECRRMS